MPLRQGLEGTTESGLKQLGQTDRWKSGMFRWVQELGLVQAAVTKHWHTKKLD